MKKISVKLSDYAQPLWQPAVWLGLALIALLWTSVSINLATQYASYYRDAEREASTLARAFEEHVIRSIQEVDQAILVLRELYEADPASFDIQRWSKHSFYAGGLTVRIAFSDANGIMRGTTDGRPVAGLDISERDRFREQVRSPEEALYISRSMINWVDGKRNLFLSRKIRTPDGGFGGIFVAIVDPERLVEFYDSIFVGRDGGVSIMGTDGYFRARGGSVRDHLMDKRVTRSLLFDNYNERPNGTFWGGWSAGNVKRLVAYRGVRGHPLIVTVALAEHEIFANYRSNRLTYFAAASGLTLIVLMVIALSIRHWRRLERARAALRRSEAWAAAKSRELEATLNNINQGIIMIDADQTVAVMNRQFVKLLGLPESFLGTRPKLDDIRAYQWSTGEFGIEGSSLDPTLLEFFRVGGPLPSIRGAYERVRPNGSVIEGNIVALDGGGLVGTFTDIAERKRNEAQIAYMARHDAVTNLANRVLLHEKLNEALLRLRRYGEGFSLICLDLDQFKAINDTLGHPAGDALLRAVGERLRNCAQALDTVARLGGDEFAILQTVTRRPTDASTLTELLLEAMRVPFDIDGHTVNIGASAGIAMADDAETGADRLFRNADLALYRAKSEGRNGYRFFDPDMDAEVRKRRALEADLRKALTENEFTLHFQPMIDLASKSVSCAEALVRWQHPARGLVSPAEFIPIAEETGLIEALGEWVLREACRTAARWPCPIKVAVNLSPVQFRKPDLAATIARVLDEAGLSAARLELEITESVMLQENERNLATLNELRALGVSVALDDFGTGYWSLSYLRSFSFDKIKIDRSFIREMAERPDCAAIVSAVAGLGRSLGMQTTAEGVETADQLKLVRAAGFAEAQGYLFSRPLPAAGIAQFLADHAEHVAAAA